MSLSAVRNSHLLSLLRKEIGLTTSCHFVIESEVKQNQSVVRLLTLSRVSRELFAFAVSFDLFTGSSVSFMTGLSDKFSCGLQHSLKRRLSPRPSMPSLKPCLAESRQAVAMPSNVFNATVPARL